MAESKRSQADKIAGGLTRRQLIEIEACSRCGECMLWCPVYPHDSREEITARGKIGRLRKMVSEDNASASDAERLDSLYACSACGQCHVICPMRIDTAELWEQARKALANAGLAQPEPQLKQMALIKECNNSYGKPQDERGRWAERAWRSGLLRAPVKIWDGQPSSILYFAGCTASFDPSMQPVAVQSTRLLQEAGVDFSILGQEEPCCASKLRRMGDDQFFQEALKRAEMFVRKKVRTIVVSCAGCFKGLHADYRGILSPDIEVFHLTEFLDRLIQTGRLNLRYKVPLSAAYHDPCHLGRHNFIYEEPRRVLRSIPGLRLVEMRRSGPFSACCGMGGGLKLVRPDLQKKMSESRIKEAEASGAEAVVTPCQTCLMGLAAGADSISSPLSVVHLNELLIRSVCPDIAAENVMAAL
ncbi:MAG TPA: (Fe-S)-binding protein, partial [Candidatus Sulfobium mesophilum]|nr:(Fe-S)-binding protein [Candidatus Sulfobium mesophilum]